MINTLLGKNAQVGKMAPVGSNAYGNGASGEKTVYEGVLSFTQGEPSSAVVGNLDLKIYTWYSIDVEGIGAESGVAIDDGGTITLSFPYDEESASALKGYIYIDAEGSGRLYVHAVITGERKVVIKELGPVSLLKLFDGDLTFADPGTGILTAAMDVEVPAGIKSGYMTILDFEGHKIAAQYTGEEVVFSYSDGEFELDMTIYVAQKIAIADFIKAGAYRVKWSCVPPIG